MRRRTQLLVAVAAILGAVVVSAATPKIAVKIVDRQYNETQYTYTLPGEFRVQSNSRGSCFGDALTTCGSSTSTSGTITPAQQVSFSVRGATFSLLLPDGRIAVVNCASKFAERFAGPIGNRRSCRMPLVDNIQAEFHGDKAKLFWNVNIDGSKQESETFKILAVLGHPKESKSDNGRHQ